MGSKDNSGTNGISQSEYERRKKRAALVFMAVYVLFMLTTIVLMAIYSHSHGYGWV
jgi:hypothetical protein